MPLLERPVRGLAIPQKRSPLGAEEVPRPSGLVHHRAERLGGDGAGQHAAHQPLRPAPAHAAVAVRIAAAVGLPRVDGLGPQAHGQGMAQAAHERGDPPEVQEPAG